MPFVSGKNKHFRGSGCLFEWNNQLSYVSILFWMAEEEIESGIYEICDMLALDQEGFDQEIPSRVGYHDACKRSIKANHRIDDHSADSSLYQLSQSTIL